MWDGPLMWCGANVGLKLYTLWHTPIGHRLTISESCYAGRQEKPEEAPEPARMSSRICLHRLHSQLSEDEWLKSYPIKLHKSCSFRLLVIHIFVSLILVLHNNSLLSQYFKIQMITRNNY